MQVAIRTSTILASMLTAIAKARLVFFSDHNLEIPLEGMPHDIESVSALLDLEKKIFLLFILQEWVELCSYKHTLYEVGPTLIMSKWDEASSPILC